METTVCSCTACGNVIGQFPNLWVQIGKTYFSPVVNSKQIPSVLPKGAVRHGSKGTLIEGCDLQDQACSLCGVLVGIKFLSVPVNHALGENQLMLNLDSAVACVGPGGKAAEINVTRRFRLQNQSATPKGSDATADAHELDQILVQLDTQGQAIDLIHQAGSNSISKLDQKLTSISRDLSNIRRDFSGSQEDLKSLKSQVQRFSRTARDKSAFDQLEEQVANLKQIAEDQTTLDNLKKDVNVLRLAHNHLGNQSRSISSRVEEIERKTSAFSEFRDEISKSIQQELSMVRAEVAQHKAEVTRAQTEELSVLRNELILHRKQVEQAQGKELAKLRAEFTKQQKAADKLRDEQLAAIREEIDVQWERISHEHQEELSTIREESNQWQEKQVRGHETATRSLRLELSECKERLKALEESPHYRVDLGALNSQLNKARAEAASFPKQLEILKTRVTEISNRTSQVDNLRMDLEILQLRLADAGRQGSEERQGYTSNLELPTYRQLGSEVAGTLTTQNEQVEEKANTRRRSATAGRFVFDQDELADEEITLAPKSTGTPRGESAHVSTAMASHTKRQRVDIGEDDFLPARKKRRSTEGFEFTVRASPRKQALSHSATANPGTSSRGRLHFGNLSSSPIGTPSAGNRETPRNGSKPRIPETKAPRRSGRRRSSPHELRARRT